MAGDGCHDSQQRANDQTTWNVGQRLTIHSQMYWCTDLPLEMLWGASLLENDAQKESTPLQPRALGSLGDPWKLDRFQVSSYYQQFSWRIEQEVIASLGLVVNDTNSSHLILKLTCITLSDSNLVILLVEEVRIRTDICTYIYIYKWPYGQTKAKSQLLSFDTAISSLSSCHVASSQFCAGCHWCAVWS